MGLWNKHQQNVLPACCHGVAHYVGWCEFPVLEPETNITDQDFKQMRTAGNQTLHFYPILPHHHLHVLGLV